MALIHPDGWRELKASGAAQRQIETLALLAYGLPAEYTVYHGVHWTRVAEGSFAIAGEIDFAIVGPTGKLLLVEQKGGVACHTGRHHCFFNRLEPAADQHLDWQIVEPVLEPPKGG